MMRALLGALTAAWVAALAGPAAQAQTTVHLAVGGKPALFYLPLTATERLNYFKAEGLDVQISDFAGGGRALQALIGGSADVVTGAFDHTIQMHAKGQPIVAVTELGHYPGFVLAILAAKAEAYRTPADLKGMKIGITAPGSSTHFMALYLMAQHGLKAADAAFIGVGTGQTAVAAVRRGEIDALINVDPVISLLESEGALKVAVDTRTPEGTRQVFGGAYPAAVLYTTPGYIRRNPKAVQSLVNALVPGLRWIATNPPERIADLMPPEYALGNRDNYVRSIRSSLPMYSPDGRIEREAAETAHKVLSLFNAEVERARIDLAATYTNEFVSKVPQ
jgi:NitT/TauT family transport system substrate-binding protein